MTWISDIVKIALVAVGIGFIGFYAYQYFLLEKDKYKLQREKYNVKLRGEVKK